MEFLRDRYPQVDLATWIARMSKGQVVNENGLHLSLGSPYLTGSRIFYYRELEAERPIPFRESIIYQDEHLLVADKPHFLPVIPAGRFLRETLLIRLRKQYQLEEIVPIHRLDRETSGIVVFSVNKETRPHYTSLFQNRKVRKVYEALAPAPSPDQDLRFPLTRRSRVVRGEPFFRMKEATGTPNTETLIEVSEPRGDQNLYQLVPVTGKKHQLRVHLAALGIAIVNDPLYPHLSVRSDDDFSAPLKLLAKSISFRDPLTGHDHFFESDGKLC